MFLVLPVLDDICLLTPISDGLSEPVARGGRDEGVTCTPFASLALGNPEDRCVGRRVVEVCTLDVFLLAGLVAFVSLRSQAQRRMRK